MASGDSGRSEAPKGGYDAFVSYSNRADYRRARRIEAFLEAIHRTPIPPGAEIRQLQICRDGSDFKLPAHRGDAPPAQETNPVWEIIESELARSRYLIVLCSPDSVRSQWVAKEIAWFVKERGAQWILPAVTGGEDPVNAPNEIFPEEIRRAGVHQGRIWYDLRALDRSPPPAGVREAEDELVRLASDLLPWEADRHGPLAALWQREHLRQRRRRATIALSLGLALTGLAAVALWQAVRSRAAAARARANAVVLAAENAADPLAGALLLTEYGDQEEPHTGRRVAQSLAAMPLPQAALRGHTQKVQDVALSPDGKLVLTASSDASAKLWPADGRGDSRSVAQFSDEAERVAFSPNGAWLAAASREGELRIVPASLRGSGRSFACGAELVSWGFSPDSRWLATVSGEGAATLWPVGGGQGKRLAMPAGRRAIRVQWSRERAEGWLAADDGSVWSLNADAPGDARVELSAPRPRGLTDDAPRLAAFSADGSRVAFADEQRIVVERTDGSQPIVLDHSADVISIDLDANGSRLLTADSRAKVQISSTADGRLFRTLDPGSLDLALESPYVPSDLPREPTSELFARFSPDGRRVVTLAASSLIRLWDAGNPGPEGGPQQAPAGPLSAGLLLTLRGHEGSEVAAFSPDGKLLATGANDGTVRVWRVSPAQEPRKLSHPGPLSSVSFATDGERLLTVARGAGARLWRGHQEQPFQEDERCRMVTAAVFDPLATQVLTGHENGCLRIWKVQGGRPRALRDLRPHASSVRGVEVSPAGDWALSWTEDEIVVQPTGGGGRPAILRVAAGKGEVSPELDSADLSPDGKRVVAAYTDGSLRVWPADGSGRPLLARAAGGPKRTWTQVSFDPSGDRILALSFQSIELWDRGGRGRPKELPEVHNAPEGWGVGVFSPDSAWVAAASLAGRVWVWSADGKGSPRKMRQIGDLAHIGPVMSLAFSRDGTCFVTTGGMDGRAFVWSLDRPENPLVIRQGGALTDAEFSPDGALVASASELGSVLVSRVTWKGLASHLRSLTSASLTTEQRVLWLGETEPQARSTYEAEERRFGRTPLPPDWTFKYPF